MQEETAANVNNVSGLLKAFVILGGILLLAGAILLAVMIAMRAGGDAPQREREMTGPVDLPLPAGVRVRQVVADGKRLVLLGEGPDGRQYIAVVDALSGARKSLIRLTPSE